jgi:Spy/CpxP family protein refolding chaperone
MKLGTRFTVASRALLMAGLLTVACGALSAQTDAPPPDGQAGPMGHRGFNPERQLQMLTRVLSLTTEQQAQAKNGAPRRRSSSATQRVTPELLS